MRRVRLADRLTSLPKPYPKGPARPSTPPVGSPTALAPELAALIDALEQSKLVAPPETYRDVAQGAAHDDTARLPAGWYAKPPTQSTRSYRTEGLAVGVGLLLGLVVTLPLAWVWRGTTTSIETTDTPRGRANSLAPADAELLPVITVDTAADDQINLPTIEDARRLIAAGNVVAARDTLATAAAAKSPRALFAMAETFDPNLLAAWGTRGIVADPARARALYEAAAGLGLEEARARLAALR